MFVGKKEWAPATSSRRGRGLVTRYTSVIEIHEKHLQKDKNVSSNFFQGFKGTVGHFNFCFDSNKALKITSLNNW